MRLVPLTLALLTAAPAFAAQPIDGSWLTQDQKAVVTIGPCGPGAASGAAQRCGRISRILAPTPNGPPRDERNPNKALRGRPILGLAVLSGFTDRGNDWRGRIYSPEEGKSYRSMLRLKPDGTLGVRGCVAIFCQSQTWRKTR